MYYKDDNILTSDLKLLVKSGFYKHLKFNKLSWTQKKKKKEKN